MAILTHEFTGGMNRDAIEERTPANTYSSALNAIHQSRDNIAFGLVNEESNRLAHKFSGQIKGWSYIDDLNKTLFFVANGNSSEIWLFDNVVERAEFVVSDTEVGCQWGFAGCNFLHGEFKRFNGCNELHVYWSSDCVFHVLNIDEMLNPERKAGAIRQGCAYFENFRASCSPHLSALASQNSGSTLEGGTVQFAVQLQDVDNNTTNVFRVSQPVSIETPDNIAGQIAKGSARLRIDNLDPNWKDVIIYVIHTVGGVETIKRMPARGYTSRGMTFEYYGQKGELVDASVLYNKNKTFLRGRDLLQKDGRMFYYNVQKEKNLNYQKWANNIQVRVVEYEVSMEMQQRYHFPSMMRGEVYALGIRWNFSDGTHSSVFHIPGGGGGGAASPDNGEPTTAQYCRSESGECLPCIICGDDCAQCDPGPNVETRAKRIPAPGGSPDDPGGPSLEDDYKPIGIDGAEGGNGRFNTDDEHDRKRNPSMRKDRPNESDKLEDALEAVVDAIDTTESSYVEAAQCEACTKECPCDAIGCCGGSGDCCTEWIPGHEEPCDCDVLPNSVSADIADIANSHAYNDSLFSEMGRFDDPDPDLTPNTFKGNAKKIIDDATRNREYETRKRPNIEGYTNATSDGRSVSKDRTPTAQTREVRTIFDPGITDDNGQNTTETEVPVSPNTARGDNWVDSYGNELTEESIRKVRELSPSTYTSSIQYPDDTDCAGDRFFPTGPVTYHQMPATSESPHFRSTQNGVVNKYQPDNYEFAETVVYPLGLKFDNVHYPSDDELPKPLCPSNPYTIMYVKRTDQNRRVFAKGWLSGMFNGEVYGKQYLYPRHGVNSFETVDRFIASGTNGTSRKGSHNDDATYTFHSPDTDADRSYLPVTHIRGELALKGSGWRHGLYAEGRKPRENQWTGTRKDNLGARVSNNLNHYDTSGSQTTIEGISYAPGNTVVTTPAGMDRPLMNRYRESSVYLKAGARLPGDERDKSFVGDVLNHAAPTQCNAPYVSLIREIPDQYGSVESLQYIELGLNASQLHGPGGFSLEGVCGDSWIGPYAKRRTSYVSNKKGDFFHPPRKPQSVCRERSICEMPDDKMYEYFGVDYYPTKLPKSGDRWDPKNYAGLHTINGECGEYGYSKPFNIAAAEDDSESDFYWPGTLKSLVCTIVESNLNPFLLETGEGPQKETGKVYYPKLKDLYLDSEAPARHPWEESYLNRFYKYIEQPSLKQRTLKTMIRSFINLIVPAMGLTQVPNMEGVLDTVGTIMVYPLLAALWVFANNALFTDRRLNQMLGIDDCLRDEEGGEFDDKVENWEDAYARYNWDYSKVNDFNIGVAMQLPYNTCDCNTCDDEGTTDLIYHTGKQNPGSDIDAYRNVKLNHYFELPAHFGKLQKLFTQGGALYAHTTDGIVRLTLQQDGTLAAEPQMLLDELKEGIFGTRSPNAAVNTPMGYVFVDEEARKLYRFNGTIPEEISNYGMSSFFKEYIVPCEYDACYDEKTANGVGYSIGWDPRYNRLLLTKKDKQLCNSFTASYNPVMQPEHWISFHSYIPEGYLWDRNSLFSIRTGRGEVWRHHEKGSYGNFYGTQYPFLVEFTAPSGDMLPMDTTNFELITDGWVDGKRDLDKTFDKIMLFNSTQSTGLREVELISDDLGSRRSQLSRTTQDLTKIRVHKKGRIYRVNEFHDLIDLGCEHPEIFTQDCDCQVIVEANEEIIDCKAVSTQDMKNRTFQDQFQGYRFVLEDAGNLRLHLKLVRTHISDDGRNL